MTIEQALRHEQLGNLPLSSPASVPPGTSLETTLRLMREQGVGCVLVCEGERLVGIFTERDVLNKLIGSGVSESESVDRFMTARVAVAPLVEASLHRRDRHVVERQPKQMRPKLRDGVRRS